MEELTLYNLFGVVFNMETKENENQCFSFIEILHMIALL